MSEAGGGTLRISIARAVRNGRDGVEVRVADSGPGIPRELREQIFNPFVTTKKTGVGWVFPSSRKSWTSITARSS